MASIVKQGKVYYVKMYDASGKQKWIKGYTDKAETRALAFRLEDEKTKLIRGDIDPAAEVRKVERAKPLTVHIDRYKAHLEAKGNSKNYVAYSIGDLKRLMDFSGITSASAVTWGLIDSWVADLRKEKVEGEGEGQVTIPADAPNTINRRVGSVKSFLRHLKSQGGVAEYTLEKYPKLKTKGLERRKRRAMSQAEINALMKLPTLPADRKLVYRVALLSGFRYSEVASLTPASFHFDSQTITVKAADAKNKARDQTVPMSTKLVKDLKKAVEGKEREVRVFTMPVKSEAAKILRKDCVAANVDPTHIDFHALRHTFITRLAEQQIHPKILQELARHSSIETTLRYYTHFKQEDERKAIDSLIA